MRQYKVPLHAALAAPPGIPSMRLAIHPRSTSTEPRQSSRLLDDIPARDLALRVYGLSLRSDLGPHCQLGRVSPARLERLGPN
jgi:hypothetical protein